MRRLDVPQLLLIGMAVAACALIAAGCDGKGLPSGTKTRPTATAPQAVPFRLNNRRTGFDGGVAPRRLTRLWTWRREPYRMAASPMVHEGRVYAAGMFRDVNATFGIIACVDAASGRTIWETTRLSGRDLKGVFSSPVLSGDGRRLVIGEGMPHDTDCHVYCLDARNGDLLWEYAVGPRHVWSTPAISGETVIVGAGAAEKNDHQPVPAHGYVAALRLADGRELWRYDVKDPEGVLAVSGGVAYLPSNISPELVDAVGYSRAMAQGDQYEPSAQALYALRIDDTPEPGRRPADRLLWRARTPFPAGGAVALTDELAIVGCGEAYFGFLWDEGGGAVVAVERATGRVRWTAELDDAVWGPVAIDDGRLYVPTRGGELIALEERTGGVVWRQRLVADRQIEEGDLIREELHSVHAGPAVGGGLVYAVSGEGTLHVLSASDGQLLEQHSLNDPQCPDELEGWSVSSPIIVDGRLYVGSETGGLQCWVGQQ